MRQLIIKIGGDMKKDVRMAFSNPSRANPDSHTLYLKNSEELYEILSPRRLELLRYIIKHQTEHKTISEAAKELKRKQEAISRDACLLSRYALIEKVKEKQMIYLKALYDSLDIKLSGAD